MSLTLATLTLVGAAVLAFANGANDVSIFKWYGDDFIEQYGPLVPGSRDARERAILGAIVKYGPSNAAELARSGRPAIRYLPYDWSLNDVQP